MRPVRVEMMGFGAFRDREVVDFSDVELSALCGPTGAGKSTIVDAITFALYGSVARYDDQRLVAPIINSLSPEGRVQLDFEVGGTSYRAVRVLRRTDRGATTKAAQLECGPDVLASSVAEMETAIVSLVGMDFDQFTKTVVLPQGAFATFLHDRPSDRQKLLRRLLGLEVYARIGEEARRRAGVARTKLETLRSQLDKADDVSDTMLAALERRLDALRALRPILARELEDLATLAREVESLEAADEHDARGVAALARLVVPDGVTSLGNDLAEARNALDAAAKTAAAAQVAHGEQRAALEHGPDQATSERLLDAYSERADAQAAIAALTARCSDTQEQLALADAELASARQQLEDSDARLRRAQERAGTTGLRARLVVGEPCPVCDQVVASIPAHDVDAELSEAQRARDEAQRSHDARGAERGTAHDAHAEAKAELAAARARVGALDARLVGAPAVSQLEADREQARRLATAEREAASVVEVARRDEATARARLEALEASEQAGRRALGKARDAVAALDPPELSGASLLRDWTELSAWAATTRHELEHRRERNAQERAAKEAERAAKQDRVRELCAPFVDGALPASPLEYVIEITARADSELDHARARRRERDELGSQIESVAVEEQVAGMLGQLLQAGGFERWLMEEVVIDLVERATTRLLELSNGQYSLVAHETEMRVVDHRNADEVRDARTLSGGETFLASLALALALADSVAELAPTGSPRLESIFLDEGFGTLDPETLDVVAAAIEELGASGRMVTIVTHIRELAERVPVRFEVTKAASTSTVARVEV